MFDDNLNRKLLFIDIKVAGNRACIILPRFSDFISPVDL